MAELPTLLVALVGSLVLAVIAYIVFALGKRSTKASIAPAAAPANLTSRPSVSVEDGKPTVRILYGTQTGTAERFSKQLGTDLRKKYGDSTVVDIRDVETYKAEDRLPKEKLVIFCMATYGDGEPTDNAAEFYNWLLKEAEAVDNGEKEPILEGVSYAVFGLGNKQYEHFNSVGKKVFKAMKSLGARAVVRRGDGDDDGVIDDDFEKWCSELHQALEQSDLMGSRSDQNGIEVPVHVPTFDVVMVPGSKEALPFPRGTGKDVHSPFWAKVTTVRELHLPQSDRSCVHAELDVTGSGIKYEHGDHVAIYAQNSAAVVEETAALLGYQLDSLIQLKQPVNDDSEMPVPFDGPISIRSALSYFADILSSPHKEALLALSTFAADRDEADRLVKLGSLDGKQQYQDFISKPHRSLLEVLRAFPSAKPSIGAFFGCVAPRLQPRFYSISSAPSAFPNSIHVTCAVVRDTMPTGRVHDGIASTWLQQHGKGSLVPVFLRHSHFKLPKHTITPIIMVGPGTGLAPFRGFLQERAAQLKSGAQLGPAHLFFGCRSRHADYIYQQELEQHVELGSLSNLHVAFSRDQDVKDYVQQHIERQAKVLWPLISDQGAYIYVCGDAKHMARDVHKTLIQVVQQCKGCTGTEAEAYIKEITDAGRYQRDVW